MHSVCYATSLARMLCICCILCARVYLHLHLYIIFVQTKNATMKLPFAHATVYLCPPQNGMTALMMACEHDQMEVVKKLLEMKADPNILDNVRIVYIYICMYVCEK